MFSTADVKIKKKWLNRKGFEFCTKRPDSLVRSVDQ